MTSRQNSEVLQSDSVLDLALWASGEELWDIDVDEGRLTRTGQIPCLMRVDNRSESTVSAFLSTVHSDDRQDVVNKLQQVSSGELEFAELSYRVRTNSNLWVWLHSRGRAVSHSPDGKVTRMVGTTRDISALKKNEERLEFALKAADEELWEFDSETHEIRRENPLVDIAYGAGGYRSTRKEFAELLHPDDIDRIKQNFLTVITGGSEQFSEIYRMRRNDGRYSWMFSQGRGLDFDQNGHPRRVLGTSRDITPVKETEERLRLSLWGSCAELWDVEMTSGLIARESKLEHLALSDDKVLFSEILGSVHEEDRAALKHAMIEHAKGNESTFEAQYRVLDVNSDWRWVLARGRVSERDGNGWAVRMLGTLQDITEIKQAEDELRRLNDELEDRVAKRTADLQHSNQELTETLVRLSDTQAQLVESEKMSSLGSLVAGIAHEINTPLGVSVTAASYLQEVMGKMDSKLHESTLNLPVIIDYGNAMSQSVQMILRNLDRADKLVKSFKQVAVDQSSEKTREISLKDYLNEILLSLNPKIKNTGHRVVLDVDPGICLVTYPGAIYQAISNLVSNSLLHGFDNKQNGTISISVVAANDQVVIKYQDDGRGMSEDSRKRVFDPFFTTKRGHGGTGLGMHIVFNLVTQLLGGSIRCDSELEKGVCFEIRIPKTFVPSQALDSSVVKTNS